MFDTLVRAVRELNKIGEPWSQSAVDSLVAAGREIAAVAIDEAPAGPNKDKAIKELQHGDVTGQRRAEARVVSPRLGLGPRGSDGRVVGGTSS